MSQRIVGSKAVAWKLQPKVIVRSTLLIMLLFPLSVLAVEPLNMFSSLPTTDPSIGIFCLIVFFLSFLVVAIEGKTHLHKSKPVMLGAGIIWVVVAWIAPDYGVDHAQLRQAIFRDLHEYASLLLFLIAAMTYISVLEETKVFAALHGWLVNRGYSYRQLFWITGIIAFFLSSIADNLTTALVMGSVVLAIGTNKPAFVSVSMINIISAANAGGVFSPFGDITTLMVWQAGRIEFFQFFSLFFPAILTYLMPASVMNFFVPSGAPSILEKDAPMERGARRIILLGILTITMAVSLEQILGLPPFMGMMIGLSFLMFFSYYLRHTRQEGEPHYDVFASISSVEWDTLLFFFGVLFSVSGLAFIGYMDLASQFMYGNWGATITNVFLGVASAVIGNIPVMFSVLSMQPEMNEHQWLLLTLTCGAGGSLLSVGSAAGIALMGASKKQYTFMSHLRWIPVIALGYVAGIGAHLLING